MKEYKANRDLSVLRAHKATVVAVVTRVSKVHKVLLVCKVQQV